MEFEILAGVVIEHGSLITVLPGWPAIMMTYHRVEENGVYNKILRHDKHCPEETHSTLCRLPQTRPPRTVTQVDVHLRIKEMHVFYLLQDEIPRSAHNEKFYRCSDILSSNCITGA